jgi:hypothetical protein
MLRIAVALCLLATVTGCARRERAAAEKPVVAGHPLVAVLPFRTAGVLDEHGVFVASAEPSEVAEDAGLDAARALSVRLIGAGVPAVSADRVLAATPPAGAAVYDARLGVRLATKLGANLAVIGAITRYVQREGSALGVRTPASIAYQAALVRTPDGAVVAFDRFDYTQQPLTSNLLDLPKFLRAGGRWVTREELIEGSLGETAEKFASALRGTGGR